MSDVPVSPASFNQAYRAYAVEQGNDVGQAMQKSSDTADANAALPLSTESAVEEDVSVSISPEAARLYAESVKRRTTVRKTEAHSVVTDKGTATHSTRSSNEEDGQTRDVDERKKESRGRHST